MAAPSLYRRYRPRTFSQVRGQDHVVGAMRNAVRSGTEGHAYLFSGPRGTGKTSTARILAKALNCTDLRDGEPCCECDSCLAVESGSSMDLFELDAASNNKVDDMRSLIGGTVVASPGRTKVYILDEVHMLSAGASNALLKTLEEPPSGVCFVLATTDPNKVLPTIRSRTQHFEFRLLSAAELESYVRWIAQDADLDLSDEAVAHVVRVGRGSARDTLSALDQVVAAGGVVQGSEPVQELMDALAGSDAGAAVQAVASALAEGHDPRVLAESVLAVLRNAFLCSVAVDVPQLLDTDRELAERWAAELGTRRLTQALERIGTALVDMRHAADPRVPLEVALVSLTASTDRLAELESRVAALEAGDGTSAAPRSRRSAGTRSDSSGPADAETDTAADSAVGGAGAEGAEPATAGGDARAARAAKARAELAASPARRGSGGATGPAPPRPGTAPRRPSADPAAESPEPAGSDGPDQAPAPVGPAPAPAPAPAGSSVAPTDPAVNPAPPESAAAGGPLGTDWVRSAISDSVLPSLRGRARALVAQAQVEGVEGLTVLLGVANEATMARTEEFVPEVARLLSTAAGRAVDVALVVAGVDRPPRSPASASAPAPASPDGDPSTPSVPPGSPPSASDPDSDPDPVGEPDDDLDVLDVDELEDASDVATTGVARLTQAFPGAVVVDDEAAS